MRNTGPSKSWFDFPVMDTLDPRELIQTCTMQDNGGTSQVGTFARSINWLKNTTWINPPMTVSQRAPGTTSGVLATNPYDYDAIEEANVWNGTHAMTLTSAQLPYSVQKLMVLRSGTKFANQIFVDFAAGVTSTDIQLSMRENSVTSGDFQNSGTATVPVFAFPTATYGGTGKLLTVSLKRPGRFNVSMRIVDNSGSYSMFEMEWYVA